MAFHFQVSAPCIKMLHMIAAAILLGLCILMLGSDVAAIQGGFAQRLDLPGSAFVPYVPVVALGVFLLAVFAILKFKVRWRWTSFVAAYLLAIFIITYPGLLLKQAARIPVAVSLDRKSVEAFEARYPVKLVRAGRDVHVRREDYSPELAAFVTELAKGQEKTGD